MVLEHKPTLKERREQLKSEKDLIAEATEIVSHVVSKVAENATVNLTWHNFGRFYRSKFVDRTLRLGTAKFIFASCGENTPLSLCSVIRVPECFGPLINFSHFP